jgi:hypothetical protein
MTINALEPSTVVLKRIYWRFWTALDVEAQRAVPLRPDKHYGLMEFDLPPGQHELRFSLPAHSAERRGAMLSFGVAVFLLLWSSLVFFRRNRPNSTH